jgi:hypothetical protein
LFVLERRKKFHLLLLYSSLLHFSSFSLYSSLLPSILTSTLL